MVEIDIRKYRCNACSSHHVHQGFTPKKIPGVYLTYGDRYCLHGKRGRRFKKSDPQEIPPSWCPRRKSPHSLRVYCFKDDESAFLHEMLRSRGMDMPCEHEYAMRYSGGTELDASGFQQRMEQKSPAELLGVEIHNGEIVEIDDGLQPYYFYFPSAGECHVIFFNGEKARKNKLQRDTEAEKESDCYEAKT